MHGGLDKAVYLAVEQRGHLSAGESFELLSGPRRLRISESFQAKMFKHLRYLSLVSKIAE